MFLFPLFNRIKNFKKFENVECLLPLSSLRQERYQEEEVENVSFKDIIILARVALSLFLNIQFFLEALIDH